jgi:MFS family permease
MARETPLLHSAGFRRLALSALLHALGMVGEQVALGWLVLELTDSPLWVGVALGVRMAPFLLAGLPAGALADRRDRVELMRAANAGMALAATVIGLLAALGLTGLGPLLVLTFLIGCGRALQQVTQQTHAYDLVGGPRLVEALAGLGIATRLGGLVGAVGAGGLLALRGPGPAYLGVAVAYLLGALVLPRAGSPARAAAPAPAPAGLSAFLAAVRQAPGLPLLVGLTAAAEVLGFSHQTLLPSLARDVLRVGPEGLGMMNAARYVGGILGIAAAGRLGDAFGPGALLVGGLATFGGAVAMLGLAPGYGAVLVLLVVANGAGAVVDVLSQTLIQRSVPTALRGRASGAWVVAIGIAPLGHLQIGALASWVGVGAGLGASGLALLGLAVLTAVRAPRLGRP